LTFDRDAEKIEFICFQKGGMMETKRTLLYDRHVAQGANMAVFGGYEMPLWYPSGAKAEHLTVLTAAGMFDTSHMAVVKISGTGASDLLQVCFSRDINACIGAKQKPLESGRCVYGVYLNEKGRVIDDSIVYRLEKESYIAVVNAGMGAKIAGHLSANKGSLKVEIGDLTDKVGKLDVQGPDSAKILSKILANPEKIFENMPYFSFKGHFDPASPLGDQVRLSDGTAILLSRTGYTGEFGFEIFISPDHLVRLWDMILEAGKSFGLISCGLAARDSLRAGAVLPLSHQDIGNWLFLHTPWSFALPFNKDKSGFTKFFIGDKPLRDRANAEFTYPFAGYDLRKISLPAAVTDTEGSEIGTVLTCVSDMGIGRHNDRIYSIASPDRPEGFIPKGLSCGFVKAAKPLNIGQSLILKDSRRKIEAEIREDIRPNRTARMPISNFLK